MYMTITLAGDNERTHILESKTRFCENKSFFRKKSLKSHSKRYKNK